MERQRVFASKINDWQESLISVKNCDIYFEVDCI